MPKDGEPQQLSKFAQLVRVLFLAAGSPTDDILDEHSYGRGLRRIMHEGGIPRDDTFSPWIRKLLKIAPASLSPPTLDQIIEAAREERIAREKVQSADQKAVEDHLQDPESSAPLPGTTSSLLPGIVISSGDGIDDPMPFPGQESVSIGAVKNPQDEIATAFRDIFSQFGDDVRLLNAREIHASKAASAEVLGCYRAGELNWPFIAAGAAIEREQETEILGLFLNPDFTGKGVCITGEPGDGKSTLAWRVALKLCEGGTHVVHATTVDRAPWPFFRSFWQRLQDAVGNEARMVILVDDFYQQGTQLERAWNDLRTLCPINILTTSRSGLYAQHCARDASHWAEIQIQHPSPNERAGLRQSVAKFGGAHSLQDANESVFESATGMLLAVDALTGGAGLERRAEDDSNALATSPDLRIGFGWICFARQFQLSFPTSLLERMGYYRLHERPELRGRIFEVAGRVRYANHSEYAKRFVEKLFRPPAQWLTEIAGSLDENSVEERSFFLQVLETNRGELSTGLAPLGNTAKEKVRSLIEALITPSEISSWRSFLAEIHESELAEACKFESEPAASLIGSIEDAIALLGSYQDLPEPDAVIYRLSEFVKSNEHAVSLIPSIVNASLRDEHLDALVKQLKADVPADRIFFTALLSSIVRCAVSDAPCVWPTNVQILIEQFFHAADSISEVAAWQVYFRLVKHDGRVTECAGKIVSLELRTPNECAMLVKTWKAANEAVRAIPAIEAFVWNRDEPGHALGVYLRLLWECRLRDRLNRIELPRTLKWLRAHRGHSASRGAILALVSKTNNVPMMTEFALEALQSLEFGENLGHVLQPLLKLVKCIYGVDTATSAEDYEADNIPDGSLIDILNRTCRLARAWLDRFGRVKTLHSNGKITDYSSVWLATLSFLKTTRNKDEFRQVAAAAINALPKNPDILTRAVEAFSDFGEEDERRVREIYERLRDLNPPKPRELTMAGWLWRHGYHSEARALYGNLEDKPGQWRENGYYLVEVHNGLGETAFYAGEHRSALRHFEKAYRIVKERHGLRQTAFTLRGLAWSLDAIGQADEAIELLESSLSNMTPRPVELLTPLAWIHLNNMNPKRAFDCFREARNKHPTYFGNHVGLLCCHCILQWREWEDNAVTALRKVGELESDLRRWKQPMPWRGIASWVLADVINIPVVRDNAVVSAGITVLIAKLETPIEVM